MSHISRNLRLSQDYIKSEVTWISEVPKHWELKRFKDFASIVRGGSPRPAGDPRFYDGDIPFLKVGDLTADENIYLDDHTYTIKEAGLEKTRFIGSGTVLLTNSGATLGIPKICTFPTTFNDGIAAFVHLRKINKVFLYYLLKSYTQWFLKQASLGQGQPNLNTEIIANTNFYYPPPKEQAAIAEYLDTKTAQLDRKIELLNQKAAKYGALKQSLINETVTKGLDKTVLMKDSGVEWVREVPSHWLLYRVKDISALKSGNSIVSEEIEENGTYPVYGGNGLRGFCEDYTHDGNYILIGRQGALCGNINYAAGKFWASEHAVVVHVKQPIDIRWYGEILRVMNLNQYSLSAAQPGLSVDRIKKLKIFVPPIEEQKAIADYLDQKTAHIDKIVSTIHAQVDKLTELRKTLINDVVTGKIKVTP